MNAPTNAAIRECAVVAVANYFGVSKNLAVNLLAEVDEWMPLEIDDHLAQRRARREAIPDPFMGESQAL